jgi:hypothetical protein
LDIKLAIFNAEKTKSKKSEIKEIDIEDDFCKYAKYLGCKAIKLVFLNKRGFPDRTVLCMDGRIFFIEFKKKDKKPTRMQKLAMKMLIHFGFEYYVCDELHQADRILDKFLSR